MTEQHAPQLKRFISNGTTEDVFERYAALPEQARGADYGEFDHNIVVLDTETTGFSLNHDELTQIAAARMEKGEIVYHGATADTPKEVFSKYLGL